MSLLMSLCAVFSPRDVLDEIWDLIRSVSEGFLTYFFIFCVITLFKGALDFINLYIQVEEKYNIPVLKIKNAYKRSKKGYVYFILR